MSKRSLLHLMCSNYDNGSAAMMELLIAAGAAVGARDSQGMSPLMLAMEADDLHKARTLLAYGAGASKVGGAVYVCMNCGMVKGMQYLRVWAHTIHSSFNQLNTLARMLRECRWR